MKVRLSTYIYFNRCNDEMIVYNLKLHNVFIVNDSAADIIQILKKENFLTLEEIKIHLMNNYDYMVKINDLQDFITELYDEDIVEIEGQNKEFNAIIDKISNSRNYSDIESYFEQKLRSNNILFTALIELTYKCNLNCTHCYALGESTEKCELSTLEIFKLLEDLRDAGVFKLTLTGGELFIREDIFDILNYTMKLGFLVDIFTNGNLLNEDKIQRLSKMNIRSIQCSLYGASEIIHEKITGVTGSFIKTINCLKLCKKYSIPTYIKTVLMNLNYGDYDSLEKLSNKLGATFQTSTLLIPHLSGDTNNLSNSIKDYDLLTNLLQKDLLRVGMKNYFTEKKDNDSICGMGKSALSIDPFGDIYPCNVLKFKLGNFKTSNIKELWHNSKRLQYLRNSAQTDLVKCRNCSKKEYCFYCPGAALAFTGSMFEPYDEACLIADIKSNLNKEEKK